MKAFLFFFALFISINCYGANSQHKVLPGEHLTGILQKHNFPMASPQAINDWIAKVQQLNKDAFSHGNANLIKPGAMLILPDNPNDKAPLIGQLLVKKGTITITSSQGAIRQVNKSAAIHEGDIIDSKARSRAQLTMSDKASFELGEKSSFSIKLYQYEPGSAINSQTLLKLTQGVLRASTGLIGKLAPKKFDLRTPAIAIGIRGTEYVARHCIGASCGAYEGTSLAVESGQISATSKEGSANLRQNEFISVSPTGVLSDIGDIPEGFLNLDVNIQELNDGPIWCPNKICDINSEETYE